MHGTNSAQRAGIEKPILSTSVGSPTNSSHSSLPANRPQTASLSPAPGRPPALVGARVVRICGCQQLQSRLQHPAVQRSQGEKIARPLASKGAAIRRHLYTPRRQTSDPGFGTIRFPWPCYRCGTHALSKAPAQESMARADAEEQAVSDHLGFTHATHRRHNASCS